MAESRRSALVRRCWEFSSIIAIASLTVWLISLFVPITVPVTRWFEIKTGTIWPMMVVATFGLSYFLIQTFIGQAGDIEQKLRFRIIRIWSVFLALTAVAEVFLNALEWRPLLTGVTIGILIIIVICYSSAEILESDEHELQLLKLSPLQLEDLYLVTMPMVGNVVGFGLYGADMWKKMKSPISRLFDKAAAEVD